VSSDNYLLLRKHPLGGFCVIDASASDDRTPVAMPDHQKYETLQEARVAARDMYSEYGMAVHPECDDDLEVVIPKDLHFALEDRVTLLEDVIWIMWSQMQDASGFVACLDREDFYHGLDQVVIDVLGEQAFREKGLSWPSI
jgi:hypothetical protein